MMEISEPQHPTRGGVAYVWQPSPDARIDFSASSSEIFTRIDREREGVRFEVHNKPTTTKLRPNLQIDWWDCYTLRFAPVITMMDGAGVEALLTMGEDEER